MEKKREQAWFRFVHLSGESTAHGYHNIYRTPFFSIRLLWIILFACSVGFCAYLVISAITSYLQYDVTTKIRLVYESPLDFPVITMCNTKPMMTWDAYMFSRQEILKLAEQNGGLNPSEIALLYGTYNGRVELKTFYGRLFSYASLLRNKMADPSFNQTLRKSFGLALNDFVINSLYAGQYVRADMFKEYYDSIYGNCFKLNSDLMNNVSGITSVLKQRESGKTNGFKAIFFIDAYPNQLYNYMDSLGLATYGVKLSIDDQNTIPVYTDSMIPIEPGTCTFIGVKKIVSKRLPYPYSSCQDLSSYRSSLYDKFIKSNKTYSQKVCFEICKQQKVIQACNCSVAEYPNIDNYPSCQTLDQLYCFWGMSNVNVSDCHKFCPLECESTTYDYTITSEIFPDKIYFNVYRSFWQVERAFAKASIPFEQITFDALSKSLACVYVYFEDMHVTRIVEAKSTTEVSLFSSIGGSLGLCLGMSILSFCELVELLAECIFILVGRRVKVGEKNKQVA